VRRRIQSLLIPVLLIFAVVGAASSAGAQTPVIVEVDSVELEVDATEGIPILVQGSPGSVALHVEITYDPAALQWVSLDNGEQLSSNSLAEVNPDTPGRVIIGIATLDEIAGSGTVLMPRFQMLAADGVTVTVTVGLENVAGWDADGFDILIETRDGQLAVSGAGGGFPLWIIIVVAVVALALIGWYLSWRRSSKAVHLE
jgi:hypothetical protein